MFSGSNPKTLNKFDKLVNAQKIKYLDPKILPKISKEWNECFNRNLRNAIGHNSIFHDLGSGMLILEDQDFMPYSEFVAHTIKITPILYFCLHVIKMIYIPSLIFQNSK